MAVRIVQLGSPRARGEGLRIGTVRRPPRGVPKTEYAARDFYDVWLPELAPSAPLVEVGLKAIREKDDRAWRAYAKRYLAEMRAPGAARMLDLLAALSHQTSFAVGCYCADESRCHRALLRRLLEERGATVAS